MPAPAPNPRPADDDSPIQGRHALSAWFETFIARLTPPCTQVTRIISDSLERPPGWRTRLNLRVHYLICCYCRRYEKQLHALRRFTAALPEHLDKATPQRLGEAEKQRLKERLRAVD